MSTLTIFPLEPGSEDYSFLDWAVKDFKCGLDSVLTDSVVTPDLEVSFKDADAMPSSVSSGFLCLVSTHSDNSSIKCCTLWCQAGALLLPAPQVDKISAYELILHISCHLGAFGIQASLPPNSNTDLSNFQTGSGAVAHAIFDTKLLILIPELHLLIQLPLCKVLMEE